MLVNKYMPCTRDAATPSHCYQEHATPHERESRHPHRREANPTTERPTLAFRIEKCSA